MRIVLRVVLLAFSAASIAFAEEVKPADPLEGKSSCMFCHRGIEDIRDYNSKMMKDIVALGKAFGDPKGCVVCHGGDPKSIVKEEAHAPGDFRPDPGSPWVNEKSCGECHGDHTGTQWTSLMMTESGKIQGASWAFGALQGYDHKWANYDAKNPPNATLRQGTESYRAYMEALAQREPQAFPRTQTTVPPAPTDFARLKANPELAAWTYVRTECQRCHLAVKGRYERGDYRGMGCSACHMPYSNEGFYEGKDDKLPRDKPGHVLVHSMQSTRKSKVTVGDKTYSGIPIETCTTCHARGKRVGVSYQGLMESASASPYRADGQGQVALHTKHYFALHQDIHAEKGMLCGDCHTSIDVHGDGFLCGTNLAQIQIECTDCHGTPEAYPWELPLGAMDEFAEEVVAGEEARGTSTSILPRDAQGTLHDAKDGYLLTARGNPYPEVVRDGNEVIVYTAGGKNLRLKPLKLLSDRGAFTTAGRVAMKAVRLHMDTMECYSCHAQWAPQCYGCHVKIDYSKDKKSFDWVQAGHLRTKEEHARARDEKGFPATVPGKVEESRSYMRWEDPSLAVNGEGRVAPTVPGCQPNVTVIGPDGKAIRHNHIFRTKANVEGGGEQGQLAIDHSPGQPHTMAKTPRTCESCHLSAKALGHGLAGGTLNGPWNESTFVDLTTAEGEVLPSVTRPQIEPIKGLTADWSRFVTEDGQQLMTVGHHWSLSRPLNNAERKNMDRQHLCLACHQEIPEESLAVSVLHHIAMATGQIPRSPEEHHALVHKTLLFAAWGQTAGIVGGPIAGGAFIVLLLWYRRRKPGRAAEESGADSTDKSKPQG